MNKPPQIPSTAAVLATLGCLGVLAGAFAGIAFFLAKLSCGIACR